MFFFYGCGKCNTNRDSNRNLKELNCFEKKIQKLQKSTQEKIEELEEEGFANHHLNKIFLLKHKT